MKEYIDSQEYPPNEAPNVFYVVLTSCDKYGRPEFPVTFFDRATKRSFKKHDIQVITVLDLFNDFKQAYPDWDGKSDIFPMSNKINHENNQRLTKLLEDCCKRRLSMDEFDKKMVENGINRQNAAVEYFKRIKNPNYQVTFLDVYIMLFSFIKKHRKDHIFVDEVSILHSKFSKFISNLTPIYCIPELSNITYIIY